MAKKKKSKNILKSYGGFAVLVLTVATFTMLFLTNVKYPATSTLARWRSTTELFPQVLIRIKIRNTNLF